jgi:nucleoid DNA-binding protein
MDQRDKIIKQVAQRVGLSKAKVLSVVMSQCKLARTNIQKGHQVSIYLRKVGTFISPEMQAKMREEQMQARALRNNNKTTKDEDPITFD